MYNSTDQEPQSANRAQDEIDLGVIFNKLGAFTDRIKQGILKLILISKKRALMLLLFLFIGAGLGYAVSYTTKPYYTSSMTLMLANIRNEFIENQLINLTVMVEEDNFSEIADRLDISEELAASIKEMKFANLDQDKIEEDSILIGSPFRIELSLFDSKNFDVMEPALVSYLENNRYFAKQRVIKQRQIESMISRLKGEIYSIDSIKTNVVEPRGPVNGFVYGQPIDPTNLYRESIKMYEQQVKLEAALDQLDNVEIVTGFAPKLRPAGPRRKYFALAGGLMALLVGLIVAFNQENKLDQVNRL